MEEGGRCDDVQGGIWKASADGALKQTVAEVLCFQSNSLEQSFEITFCTSEACREVLEECRRQGALKPVSSFEVMSLDRPNFRIVTLHIYNPHVTDQAVAGFLGQYAEVLTEARRVRDTLGFWTGKRQYQVLFKPVPEGVEGFEGFLHPPARFSIGGRQGLSVLLPAAPLWAPCKTCPKPGQRQARPGRESTPRDGKERQEEVPPGCGKASGGGKVPAAGGKSGAFG
ncbi:hypothetical protein SKAU_G00387040 [Synaphobranchus kaupii]|uniref:Uncharacterized protein n=1 Tax=Synaphobranchus kaupii TaxID=118154 RepID=A0A9Q1EAV3_SYNKA|nr:hypothetical protein SKAU_G00387040 [Synaphobranchus kaupii]